MAGKWFVCRGLGPAVPLCATAHPLHITNIFGTSLSETTMGPNPRFVCRGLGTAVPRFLRLDGKVRNQSMQNQTRSVEASGFVGDTLEDAFGNICATYNQKEMTKEIYKKVLSETELYDK